MRRWLLPGLLLLALGCGRKEASQPEAVVQVLPAVAAEPEQAQEPEPVRKPEAAIQPDAAPEAASAGTAKMRECYSKRVIPENEFKRMPWIVGPKPESPSLRFPHRRIVWHYLLNNQPSTSGHKLLGYEVERGGGIFEAVKTLPGVSGW
jgi:hypothetical protein